MKIIAALLVFTVLIVIHEFGHFLFAKLSGIRVEEFSVGMGPQIFSVKKGETEYSLRAIPLGGYCKMTGEDEAVVDPKAFSSKPLGSRFMVVIAGAVMNVLLCIFLLSFSFGVTTKIDAVSAGMPAAEAGLKAGDQIVRINDTEITDWEQVRETVGKNGAKELQVEIKRNGKSKVFQMTPELDKDNGVLLIGVSPKVQMVGFSIASGAKLTWEMAGDMLNVLRSFVTGHGSMDDVVGPLGIVVYLGDAAKTGMYQLIFLAAMLSLNLGIINMLPLPALDGGRCLFLIIEGIRGKAIDPEKEGFVHFLGFALLIMLSIFIFYKDIIRFFG